MKTNQNEELQSRREFFKKAAKAALPVVGAVVMASLPIEKLIGSSACYAGYACTGACSGSCKGTCKFGCEGCKGACEGSCKYSCKTSCYHSSSR